MALDLAAVLTEYADTLAALPGVKSASPDPARVNRLPGVWVLNTGVDFTTLDGGAVIDLRLLLVAPSRDHMRAVRDLSDLLAAVTAVAAPTGPVTPAVANLNEASLPAFAFPTRIRWTPDPE